MTGASDAGLVDLLQELRTSRERLLSVVAGVTEEQFKRRPAVDYEAQAGEWSIAEVLAHLLASETRHGARLEALRSGEQSTIPLLDEEARNAEARQGRAVPVPQIIHGLLAARRHIERLLAERQVDAASDAVQQLVGEDVVQHEAAHTSQIEAVKAALAAARSATP